MSIEMQARLKALKGAKQVCVVHYGKALTFQGLVYSWTSGVDAKVFMHDPKRDRDLSIPVAQIRKIVEVAA